MKPRLHLIGGPNGAGKTTFAREYLPNEADCLRFLNSDEIARGLSPFDASLAQRKAGRILLNSLRESLEKRESLALESTLSGLTYLRYLREAKAAGYHLSLHFLWLPSAEASWQRVEQRVHEGGHHVPKDSVFRRFPRIQKNVATYYAPLVDEWFVWDSSQTPPAFVGRSGDGAMENYL